MPRRSSKTRSATNSQAEPPSLPPVYLDESVSQRFLAGALRLRGVIVYTRAELFPAGVSDPEWLEYVGSRGWIAITKDQHIRKRPNELEALLNSGARAFVLTAGEMTGPDQAELFARLIPKMVRVVRGTKPPFVARVERIGRIEIIARRRRR